MKQSMNGASCRHHLAQKIAHKIQIPVHVKKLPSSLIFMNYTIIMNSSNKSPNSELRFVAPTCTTTYHRRIIINEMHKNPSHGSSNRTHKQICHLSARNAKIDTDLHSTSLPLLEDHMFRTN